MAFRAMLGVVSLAGRCGPLSGSIREAQGEGVELAVTVVRGLAMDEGHPDMTWACQDSYSIGSGRYPDRLAPDLQGVHLVASLLGFEE
jgi:hypothetical protein